MRPPGDPLPKKDLQGRVLEIYLGPEREAPMSLVPSAHALAHKGLAGDRYASGRGSYSKSEGIGDLTLIEIESLWGFCRETGIDLHPSLTRRNIVTEGIRLSELIGQRFFIGPVACLGLRLCPPCLHLAKLTGIPEVLKGLAHAGGIYAQVLGDGIIHIDDSVSISSASNSG